MNLKKIIQTAYTDSLSSLICSAGLLLMSQGDTLTAFFVLLTSLLFLLLEVTVSRLKYPELRKILRKLSFR